MSRVDFVDLPCLVVVVEILPFLEVDPLVVCRNEDEKYALFGYFKKDITRKIFMIFKSLRLPFGMYKASDQFCHGYTRTISLRLELCGEVKDDILIAGIVEMSKDMKDLTRLELVDPEFGSYVAEQLEELFSDLNCFPNLQTLLVNGKEVHEVSDLNDCSSERMKLKVFPKLLNLRFSFARFEHGYFVDWERSLGRVKKLDLHCVGVEKEEKDKNLAIDASMARSMDEKVSEKKVKLVFPHLRELSIVKCKLNLRIVPGGELTSFKYENDPPLSDKFQVIDVIEKSRKLRHLDVSGFEEGVEGGWLLDREFCHLRSFSIGKNFSFSENDLWKWNRFKDRLEVVKISHGNFNNDILDDTKYPSMRTLFLHLCREIVLSSSLKWNASDNLTILTLSGFVNDEIFQRNKFPFLQKLVVIGEDDSPTTGKDWKKLPSIRTLCFSVLKKFTDDFFKNNEFECLRKLEVNGLKNITGSNWNESVSRNLEVLSLHGNKRFGDSFFQSNSFNCLKVVDLFDMSLLTGEGWKMDWKGMVKRGELKKRMCYGFSFGF